MMEHELTQQEWADIAGPTVVAGASPSYHTPGVTSCDPIYTGDCPVERINWFDAIWYANELSVRHGLAPCYSPPALTACLESEPPSQEAAAAGTWRPGGGCGGDGTSFGCDGIAWTCEGVAVEPECMGFRLPTEAEWEYAARAGSPARFWFEELGSPIELADVSWSGRRGTHPLPVAEGRLPNPWGLFDLQGNVSEWTDDWYGAYAAEDAEPVCDEGGVLIDPHGPEFGAYKAVKGGSWHTYLRYVRPANRGASGPSERSYDRGFRLVRSVAGAGQAR